MLLSDCPIEGPPLWPTPCAADWKNRDTSKQGACLQRQIGGQLNPAWVEWLMGWPIGWTGLGRLETDGFRQWRRAHGVSSREGSDFGSDED